MDLRVSSLADAAALEFGRLFRYSDFSTYWVDGKVGITRSRTVSKTVTKLHTAVWNLLDERSWTKREKKKRLK